LKESKDSRKIRIRRQIGNLRSELSLPSHSGLSSDNIELNIKERIIFHKYELTNYRAIVKFIEELKQKTQSEPQKIRRNEKRINQYTQNRRRGSRTVGIKDCM
jgi:hypothetical protein